MPPISIILPLKRNIEEKFAVLRIGNNYNATTGYNTFKQAQEDGAIVMAYGYVYSPGGLGQAVSRKERLARQKYSILTLGLTSSFIYNVVTFVMVGVSLYALAHLYTVLSSDPIIKHTKKCKYCRQRINEKVGLLGVWPSCVYSVLMVVVFSLSGV